jgi:hypothetical protein
MRRSPGVLLALLAVLIFGMLVASHDTSQAASPDTTIITIAPDMPDDFLNLYPDFDNNELAALPSTGTPIETFASLGILTFGVLAIAFAVATTFIRTRRRNTFD